MDLSRFPVELIEKIIREAASIDGTTAAALARVSRPFNAVLTHLLYTSVIIRSRTSLDLLLRTLVSPRGTFLLSKVRRLDLSWNVSTEPFSVQRMGRPRRLYTPHELDLLLSTCSESLEAFVSYSNDSTAPALHSRALYSCSNLTQLLVSVDGAGGAEDMVLDWAGFASADGDSTGLGAEADAFKCAPRHWGRLKVLQLVFHSGADLRGLIEADRFLAGLLKGTVACPSKVEYLILAFKSLTGFTAEVLDDLIRAIERSWSGPEVGSGPKDEEKGKVKTLAVVLLKMDRTDGGEETWAELKSAEARRVQRGKGGVQMILQERK